MQAKLLRVLEQNEVERVGRRSPVEIDRSRGWLRHIANPGRWPRKELRQDLFHRIIVFPLLPPLRERAADIRPADRLLPPRPSRTETIGSAFR